MCEHNSVSLILSNHIIVFLHNYKFVMFDVLGIWFREHNLYWVTFGLADVIKMYHFSRIVVWCRLSYVVGGGTAKRNWDGANETPRKKGEHEHSGVLHHVWLAFLWQPYCASQKWSSSGIIFVELSLLLSLAVNYYIETSVNMHLVVGFSFHEWYKSINTMIPTQVSLTRW